MISRKSCLTFSDTRKIQTSNFTLTQFRNYIEGASHLKAATKANASGKWTNKCTTSDTISRSVCISGVRCTPKAGIFMVF